MDSHEVEARWDWDEAEVEAAASKGGKFDKSDFDIHGVQWPMWLECHVFYSKAKANSKGTGTNVSLGFEVLTDGPWKGFSFFQTFVFTNPSEKAQAMGRVALGKIAQAAELEPGMDFNELKDYAQDVDVECVVEASEEFGDKLVGQAWAKEGTKVSYTVCEGAAKRYKPKEAAKEEATGSHRYAVDEPKEPVSDTDLDDDIPF